LLVREDPGNHRVVLEGRRQRLGQPRDIGQGLLCEPTTQSA
jgi:hypothetical protein